MNKKLLKSALISGKKIQISGSKSETNRILLLKALFPNILIENTSNSDDSEIFIKALEQGNGTIDIHHAGTAMRFLTAFFAIQNGKNVLLTGSSRMKERPIGILVDALRQLGAEISYAENEGFPPLNIKGKSLIINKIEIPANVSSQYISALLLIAPFLDNGLKINLLGEITSTPYIKMTLALLNQIGVKTSFENQKIEVEKWSPSPEKMIKMVVESDWSSASYWYSFVALSPIGTSLILGSYKQNSLQGDSILAEIYQSFGVKTSFENGTILLEKITSETTENFSYDLKNAPDIAQTIAVTCFGLGISCELFGLQTLKIKETDRLSALKNELTKLGAKISITDEALFLEKSTEILPNISIKTYNDHRMAMAFAPLSLKTDIIITDYQVVTKSYPNFWNDFETVTEVL